MPKQDTADSGAAEQEAPSDHVQTVEKPTVGRVVHVNVGWYGQEPVLRPGIVLATDVLDSPDAVTVAVFLKGSDHPLPPGLNIRQPEVGTTAYPAKAQWQIECCHYGSGSGRWSWPVRGEAETFEFGE